MNESTDNLRQAPVRPNRVESSTIIVEGISTRMVLWASGVTSPSFASLGLSPVTLRAVERAAFDRPTPIQIAAIPPILARRDVIGCAATGTGKTAAFVLPLLDHVRGKSGLLVLILAPTRELATQLSQEVSRFGDGRRTGVATLVGGSPVHTQRLVLAQQPTFVIGTPGRVVDHLEQGHLQLEAVEHLVLDEADRMLDMGFQPQLTRILKKVPRARQTLLFSATLAGEVDGFARKYLANPVRLEVTPSGTPTERTTQAMFEVAPNEKLALLLTLLKEKAESTLVFVRTKRRVDKIAGALERAGHRVERLHADRSQGQRRHALESFRQRKVRVLVATDVAARGLDVANIAHVINVDLPHEAEDYVHRVGRTGRASSFGKASTFVVPEDAENVQQIERLSGMSIPRTPVPREDLLFRKVMDEAAAKQADPGPPQKDHGVSKRPAGQAPGRHARSHRTKAPPKR